MIFSGTENMKTYPHIEGSTSTGIFSYGTVKAHDGIKAYKAPLNDMTRLQDAGWKIVGNGKSYLYVRKGA